MRGVVLAVVFCVVVICIAIGYKHEPECNITAHFAGGYASRSKAGLVMPCSCIERPDDWGCPPQRHYSDFDGNE